LAIKNAIRVATEFIEQQVNPRIVDAVRAYNEKNAHLAQAAPEAGIPAMEEAHAD
jgi:hypothetical protein